MGPSTIRTISTIVSDRIHKKKPRWTLAHKGAGGLKPYIKSLLALP